MFRTGVLPSLHHRKKGMRHCATFTHFSPAPLTAAAISLRRFYSEFQHLVEDIFGMIGTADKRAGEHPADTETPGDVAQAAEFVRMIVLLDFSVLDGWAEVL